MFFVFCICLILFLAAYPGPGCGGNNLAKRSSLLLPTPLGGDTMVFPNQQRYIISPACPLSAMGSPIRWACPKQLQGNIPSRNRHLTVMKGFGCPNDPKRMLSGLFTPVKITQGTLVLGEGKRKITQKKTQKEIGTEGEKQNNFHYFHQKEKYFSPCV